MEYSDSICGNALRTRYTKYLVQIGTTAGMQQRVRCLIAGSAV